MTVQKRPNIVYILADDLGYGDVSCLNPEGKIATPHIDRIAAQGMAFTDAHSTSAVCTPSRYSILTGRYNWRSPLQQGVLGVYGPPLIPADRATVPRMLQGQGYRTMCVGKWHLGMGWPLAIGPDFWRRADGSSGPMPPAEPPTFPDSADAQRATWREAFSGRIDGGPLTAGFDHYFGLDVPNFPPYCYIEDDHTLGIPSEWLPARLVGNNLASYTGPAMPYWHFEQLLPEWAKRSDRFIADAAAANDPFFLFLPLTSPHTPLSVNKPFIGASGLSSLYADLVIETDYTVGQVLASLERHGVADETLVIFTSDNGAAHYADGMELEAQGHRISGPYRGYKSDVWDGGHRVPLVVRWPGVIQPGTICPHLVCLSDLYATLTDVLGEALPPDAGEDSVSMMPAFRADGAIREQVVHHSYTGKFALRDERWKLVLTPGSGGWTLRDTEAVEQGLPLMQLYDMQEDPGETRNLFVEKRSRVRDMLDLLQNLVDAGRSTPGPRQANDVPVDLWKLDTMPGVDASVLDDL